MSSNDYLLLAKTDKVYALTHRECGTDAEFERWEFDTLEKAIKKAMKEQYFVEYGIIVDKI